MPNVTASPVPAVLLLALGVLLFSSPARAQAADAAATMARTPVIFDTDIGDDTDDYWALACVLKNPDFDVKLITTTFGKQQYRAALIAKFLTAAGRTDIPIGLGAGGKDPNEAGGNQAWLNGFTLADYKGKVDQDGAQAIVDTINKSPGPVTVIAVGPVNTLGAALAKDPGIAAKASLCAMAGSIKVGYSGKPGAIGEYNVCRDIPDAKAVFSAPWKSISIAPLDVADSKGLSGPAYAELLASSDPLLTALLDCYATAHKKDYKTVTWTGTGFDPAAVYLAEHGDPGRFATIEVLKIIVDDTGKTVEDPSGREMKVATSWKDLGQYLDHLKTIALMPPQPAGP